MASCELKILTIFLLSFITLYIITIVILYNSRHCPTRESILSTLYTSLNTFLLLSSLTVYTFIQSIERSHYIFRTILAQLFLFGFTQSVNTIILFINIVWGRDECEEKWIIASRIVYWILVISGLGVILAFMFAVYHTLVYCAGYWKDRNGKKRLERFKRETLLPAIGFEEGYGHFVTAYSNYRVRFNIRSWYFANMDWIGVEFLKYALQPSKIRAPKEEAARRVFNEIGREYKPKQYCCVVCSQDGEDIVLPECFHGYHADCLYKYMLGNSMRVCIACKNRDPKKSHKGIIPSIVEHCRSKSRYIN